MTKRGPKGLTIEQVIAAIKETNGNMAMAARRLKVERQAIKYYVDNHATVKAAHDEAAAVISDIAEGHLVAAVIKGNLDQGRYWLENKARDRGYGAKYNLEITGKDGGPLIFSHAAVVAALATGSTAHPGTPSADKGDRDG